MLEEWGDVEDGDDVWLCMMGKGEHKMPDFVLCLEWCYLIKKYLPLLQLSNTVYMGLDI